MTNFSPRDFNCKNEELPVICRFVAFSMRRDLVDFTNYSPKFNEVYLNSFESKTTEVDELVEPKSETVQLKKITARLYATLNRLINPINRLEGYINLAYEDLQISPADFGLSLLRKGINKKDVESVLKNLKTVNTNISNNMEILAEQGLQPELAALFLEATESVAADKQSQYEIVSNRKAIVQNNIGILNSLFEQMTEILKIGKILYKDNDPVKLQEYTFTELKKRVRKSSNGSNGKTNGDLEDTNNTEE